MRPLPKQVISLLVSLISSQCISVALGGSLMDRVAAAYENQNKVQFCGKRLTEFLHVFCMSVSNNNHRFYNPSLSGLNMLSPQRSPNSYPRGIDLATLEESNGIRRDWATRGIIDECCYEPCGPSTLRKYCGRTNLGESSGTPATIHIATLTTTSSPTTTTAGPKETNWDKFEEEDQSSSQEKPYLIPLLLDIIYNLQKQPGEPSTTPSPPLNRATYHTFNPHAHTVGDPSRLLAARLAPRDTHRRQNGTPPYRRFRNILASDETRRDEMDSRELTTTSQPPVTVHQPPRNWRSSVKQVTDDWGTSNEAFAISAGTNYADVSEHSVT